MENRLSFLRKRIKPLFFSLVNSSIGGFLLPGLLIATALTVISTQRQQEYRQQAATQNPLIYQGGYTRGNMSALDQFEKDAGKKSALTMIYGSWQIPLSTSFLTTVRARGSIPVYGWTSTATDSTPNQPQYSLHNIINGNFDTYITKFALDAKAWGHPFFLKLDQEMNDGWPPWGLNVNGNKPGEFAAMWRHVHGIFTANGVTNVTWVWCPGASGSLATLQDLYPGDTYVDWVCMDGYNKGTWRSFTQIFDSTYQIFHTLAPSKPIMIGEFASQEQGGSKANWITDALTNQIPNNYPNIKAIIWWNIDQTHEAPGVNWQIESSPTSQQAYAAAIQSSMYANNQYANFDTSPIPPLGVTISSIPSISSPFPSPTPGQSPSPSLNPASPTPTLPCSTNTPIPTDTSIPFPTNASPTTAISGILTPTPTLGPPTGNLSLHFEGIDGNNNLKPINPQRNVILTFFKTNNFFSAPAVTLNAVVTFVSGDTNGSFVNSSVDLSMIPTGNYYVLAKSPEGSLQELLNPSQTVNIAPGQNAVFGGQNNQNPVNMRLGDLNNDNTVDVKDYSIIVDCFGVKQTSPACRNHKASDNLKGLFADINDDGTVNGIDYNILIRHLGEQGYGQVQTFPSLNTISLDATPCVTETPTSQPSSNPSPTSNPTPQPTPTTAQTGTKHYEYVFPDGSVWVYDMDNGHNLVKHIALPTSSGTRGVVGHAGNHALYISYGSDGNSGGSLLAYDLLTDKVIWQKSYAHGIDSMSITPDGKTIYMPDGETSSSPYWYIINAADGSESGTRINGGPGPHNTVVSLNGQHVYMGARNFSNTPTYLTVADTATNSNVRNIGPFKEGIRPFTINGKESLAYVTATGFLGFQVASIASGKVLYTVDLTQLGFPNSPTGPTAPSHGIALSPDEKNLAVVDWPNDMVHIFDVSAVPSSAPRKTADIKFTRSMHHNESPCGYDCPADGWLEYSKDGRFLYVGDTGDVIDTNTNTVSTNISTLYNTRKMIEVDFQNNQVSFVPINRASVGFMP